MTQEEIQSFSLRITQANQSELTVITYEIFLGYLRDAKEALQSGNKEDFAAYNKKAQVFLCELMAALNYDNPVSFNLIKIYSFVNRQLIKVQYAETIETLETVEDIMGGLHDTFKEAASKDASNGVMENTQQVYAGLTYGRGYLNETCIADNDYSRGFRA